MYDEIPEIDLYSDGGADPNPGKGGFGVIMVYKGKRKEFSQGYMLTTNNRMELLGVIYGLERLKTKSIVNIYTDSRYVINGIEKGWAKKWKSNNWYRTKSQVALNSDLWERLLVSIAEQEDVKFNWVKGHTGHAENERCDELASLALNGENLLEDVGYETNDYTINKETVPKPKTRKKVKIEKVGDLCRSCGTAVIKKTPKKRKIKKNQTYYFEYYLYCPDCKAIYHLEEAKRNIEDLGNKLFD